jgi:hypothetical protein
MAGSFGVECLDGFVDGLFEVFGVAERAVSEMMGFQVAPDSFDVVEFGRVFRQPFDDEPVCARCERGPCRLAGVDRSVVEHNDGGLDARPRFWSILRVELLQQRDEVGAAPLRRRSSCSVRTR